MMMALAPLTWYSLSSKAVGGRLGLPTAAAWMPLGWASARFRPPARFAIASVVLGSLVLLDVPLHPKVNRFAVEPPRRDAQSRGNPTQEARVVVPGEDGHAGGGAPEVPLGAECSVGWKCTLAA